MSDSDKIGPMLFIGLTTDGLDVPSLKWKIREPICLLGDCAWWVAEADRCSISDIGYALWAIAPILARKQGVHIHPSALDKFGGADA